MIEKRKALIEKCTFAAANCSPKHWRAASRAILRVDLWAGSALLANGCIACAHHREGLLGVACLQWLVVSVGDFAGFAIELQFSQCVDRLTLRSWCLARRRHRRLKICAQERVEHVEKRRHRERGTDEECCHASRLTASSSAANSPSVAFTGCDATTPAAGTLDFQRLSSPPTITAPAPSAINGIV